MWEGKHLFFIVRVILETQWYRGLKLVFQSQTSQDIFRSLTAEEKNEFLGRRLVMKAKQVAKMETKLLAAVYEELKQSPYMEFAVLKYPQHFHQIDFLAKAAKQLTDEQIKHYFLGREKRYLAELDLFVTDTCRRKKIKVPPKFERAVEIGSKIIKAQEKQRNQLLILKQEGDIQKMVGFIKANDPKGFKNYMESTKVGIPDSNDEVQEDLNSRLHLVVGYNDEDYEEHLQRILAGREIEDETILMLISDNSTFSWNALSFAIFYQRTEIVEYIIDNPEVQLRNALMAPFEVEEDGSDNILVQDDASLNTSSELSDNYGTTADGEYLFVKQKSMLLPIFFTALSRNKALFEDLWEECSFFWNDTHLVVLLDFLIKVEWTEGLKVLLRNEATQ
jgi:hypothetical protein